MDDSESGNVMRRRRERFSDLNEEELFSRWREVLNAYEEERSRPGRAAYPRAGRLLEIIRGDGHIRLMLEYDQENPSPNLGDYGQRRQVESILGFEAPLRTLRAEAESHWAAGDFAGEAALLEEYASSNPQRDAILSLAAEARRDAAAISGATSRVKPARRELR